VWSETQKIKKSTTRDTSDLAAYIENVTSQKILEATKALTAKVRSVDSMIIEENEGVVPESQAVVEDSEQPEGGNH
jgi:hypothetical protein